MILIFSSITLLILWNVFFTISIRRLNKEKKESTDANISIVIAAKNESENIDGLIESLKSLNYAVEMFEVIFVDDNSTDTTLSKLQEQTKSIYNFSIIEAKSSGVMSKREALTLGISRSKYPFILITDADCQPEKNWLSSYSQKIGHGYDLLFGIAPFNQSKNLVNKISCFENLRNSILTFSLASIGLPYSSAARNFGFSKKAFDFLGGYSQTKDTTSGDDDLLLREAVKNKMKIGTVTEQGSFVFSETKKTFSEYFQQKARHTQTSFHYLKKHQLILGVWHLLNLTFLFSPFLMIANPLFGILFPVKLAVDFIVVKSTQKKFSYTFSTIEVFYLQIFYEIFLVVHFLNARFTKIKWK